MQVLGVADVGKDLVKRGEFAALGHRDGQTALHHEGEEPQGFQGHGLAAGVGPGNNQEALLRGQGDAGGDGFGGLRVVSFPGQEQGVPGLPEIHAAGAFQHGLPGLVLPGEAHLGRDGVELRQGVEILREFGQMVTHLVGEAPEDLFSLPFLLVGEEIQGVVLLHDGQGLQEQGGPGLGGVVDDARDHPFVVCLDRDDIAAVALGNKRALDDVLVLVGEEILLDLAVYGPAGVPQLPAHPGQLR